MYAKMKRMLRKNPVNTSDLGWGRGRASSRELEKIIQNDITKMAASITSTKINNSSSIHWQMQLWESSGVHLRNFSNTVEQKFKNNGTKKRRKNVCLLPASSHFPNQHCSVPRENSPACKKPQSEENEDEWASSFLSLWGHHMKNAFSFRPTQRPTKLRHTEAARNKEEKQGLPGSATQQEWPQFQWPAPQSTPEAFITKEPNGQHSCFRHPADFTSFHPRGIFKNLATCFYPSTPSGAQDLHWQPVRASAAVQVSCQTRTPQLTPTTMCVLRVSPSNVH